MANFVYGLVGVFMVSVSFVLGSNLAKNPHDGGSAGSSGKIEEKPLLPEQSGINTATQAPDSPPKNSFTVTHVGPKPKIFENQ